MNAYKKAMHYLKNGESYKREGYKKIDDLIEPLCHLLSEKGYITLHSCSAHIEEEKTSIQWYVVFVATRPISQIKSIVKKINKKHNYKIIVEDARKTGKEHCGLTRRWTIQYMLWDLKTKDELIETNKNIYTEFLTLIK